MGFWDWRLFPIELFSSEPTLSLAKCTCICVWPFLVLCLWQGAGCPQIPPSSPTSPCQPHGPFVSFLTGNLRSTVMRDPPNPVPWTLDYSGMIWSCFNSIKWGSSWFVFSVWSGLFLTPFCLCGLFHVDWESFYWNDSWLLWGHLVPDSSWLFSERGILGWKCSRLCQVSIYSLTQAGIPSSSVRSFYFPYASYIGGSEPIFQLFSEDCMKDPDGNSAWNCFLHIWSLSLLNLVLS